MVKLDKSTDIGEVAVGLVAGVFAAIAIVCAIVLYWALVSWIIWNWYAPIVGLPNATFGQVYAYSILLRVLMGHKTVSPKTEESKREDLINMLLSPLVTLAFGWIMLQFLR